MSQFKFCANLSFMFQEKASFCDRLVAARTAGFKGVEIGFLYDDEKVHLNEYARIREECGLEQILINAYPGDLAAGDFGLLARPGREKEFEDSLTQTFRVAETLNCKKIHFMSGKISQSESRDLCYNTMKANLQHLLPKLKEKGIIGLIEPINTFTVPDYYLSDFNTALSVIKDLNCSQWIKIQLDIFHLQQIEGNLTRSLNELMPFVGHIQIAQVPTRNEPDTPGEIDYKYILDLIGTLGYKEWIGLEYSPLNDTEGGLDWIKKLGF